MRVAFLGDIVGRSGRQAVVERLPELRRRLDLDFVVANGENAAGGFGITGKICAELFEAGVDAISGGNHSWDQKEALSFIEREPRLLRPLNYPQGTPGRGVAVFEARRGRKVLLINVMGRLFMDPLDDPFAAVAREMTRWRLGATVDFVLVDVHAEATSEKMAMAHVLDGRASLVVGTHTHVPTADAQVLPGGTGYQTDAGMCGDYDSVIGVQKQTSIERFVRKLPTERMQPAEGPATVCGVFVETDDRTGLARTVEPIRIGGRLKPSLPELALAAE